MSGSCASSRRVSLRRAALAASVFLFAPIVAAAPLTLQVETSDTLPGFHLRDLPRYLALRMADARLTDWRFEPAADTGLAPNRVEWTFKLNPYAGGEVRNFTRPHMAERTFGAHRPVTIEARLFLNGQYQTSSRSRRLFKVVPAILILPRRWPASHKISSDLRVLFALSTPVGLRRKDRDRPSEFTSPRAGSSGLERVLILRAGRLLSAGGRCRSLTRTGQ